MSEPVSPWDPVPEPESNSADNTLFDEENIEGKSAPRTRKPVHSETNPEAKKRKEEESGYVGVAYAGRKVNIATIPSGNLPAFPQDEEYVPDHEVDYSDVALLNRDLNRARARLFRTNNALKVAQRAETQAQFEWRRAQARVLAGLSGGSEKQRLAIAELETEQLWADYLVAKQVADEWASQVRAIRTDLDALTSISHNVRAQMSLM